jgi:G:T-mismatch repair DNA endonuclease (very short patch repair protein)
MGVVLGAINPVQSTRALISAILVVLACSRSFPGNVQVMMTMARAVVWAHVCCLFGHARRLQDSPVAAY